MAASIEWLSDGTQTGGTTTTPKTIYTVAASKKLTAVYLYAGRTTTTATAGYGGLAASGAVYGVASRQPLVKGVTFTSSDHTGPHAKISIPVKLAAGEKVKLITPSTTVATRYVLHGILEDV